MRKVAGASFFLEHPPPTYQALWASRLRSDTRGRDGGVRQELAGGVVQWKPKIEVEATSILPP
jgi:hypothetical protein